VRKAERGAVAGAKSWLRCALAAIGAASALAVVLPAAPALAYDAGPHTELTTDSLTAEGFGEDAVGVAVVNNWFVDFYQQQEQVPFSGHAPFLRRLAVGAFMTEDWPDSITSAARRSHFDDSALLDGTGGLTNEWDRLRRAVYTLVQEAREENNPGKLLAVIGMSLHQVQDFYSHTNWTEPQTGMGANGPGWQQRGFGTNPTWFDVPASAREQATVYANGTPGHRAHGDWNGDSNRDLSTTMAKDWPGRPLYQRSVTTAYFASRQWVEALRAWVADEDLWARAQRYQADQDQLDHDLDGMHEISLYSGHWQGQGEPLFGNQGVGGDLLELRRSIKNYFQPGHATLLLGEIAGSVLNRKRTKYRALFEKLIPRMADPHPTGELAPVPSSREIQRATQFVTLKVTGLHSIELGDPGPDNADMYARVRIDGQEMFSAIVQGRDDFEFGNPFEPFTWTKAVPRVPNEGVPVESIEVEVKTCDARWAGTNDDVFLRLGAGRMRFELDKRLYNDFERGDRDTYSVPIDNLLRRGMTIGEIRRVQIEKDGDGVAGGWKLCGVKLRVNGQTAYRKEGINRWLEDDKRIWLAPDFEYRDPHGQKVPVWINLLEDDYIYGGDDEGDIHPYANRRTVSIGYLPTVGQPLTATTKGASTYGGRTIAGKLDDGDEAWITYSLETMVPEVADPPATPAPPRGAPPAALPDLVITEFDFRRVTVANLGEGPAGPFRLRVNDARDRTVSFPGLAPGATATRDLGLSCVGIYHATVDDLEQVTELDETDNEAVSEPVIC
jgi:hypothetical protein